MPLTPDMMGGGRGGEERKRERSVEVEDERQTSSKSRKQEQMSKCFPFLCKMNAFVSGPSAQIETALLPVRKGREKVERRLPTKLFVAPASARLR